MEENNTTMSAEINEIAAALSAFQGELKQPELSKEVTVPLTRTGGNYKFKYADLFTCIKAAAPKLKEHGLSVTQLMLGGKLVTILAHKSGQWFRSELTIGNAANFQALGSAITYLKRYSYCAILGIVADSDDDANAACGNTAIVKDLKKPVQVAEASPELVAEAVNAIRAVKSREEMRKVWDAWKERVPSTPNTDFFEACRVMGKKYSKK